MMKPSACEMALSALTFYTVSVIGISVKSHIGTSLDYAITLIKLLNAYADVLMVLH